jgi:hypothetical protein
MAPIAAERAIRITQDCPHPTLAMQADRQRAGHLTRNIERIFVAFERLGAEQTAAGGTGIGLPPARALTEAMGGRLTASSVPGQGSAFTISLPRAPDMVHAPAPGLASVSLTAGPHSPPGASIRVMTGNLASLLRGLRDAVAQVRADEMGQRAWAQVRTLRVEHHAGSRLSVLRAADGLAVRADLSAALPRALPGELATKISALL